MPRPSGKGGFDSLAGERALKSRFGLATLDGFGAPGRAELAAAGGLLAYLDATQKEAAAFLAAPRRIARSEHMAIDPATRDSLEICRTQTGSVAGSLLGCIDRCVTAPGRRLLAADLSAPLTDIRAIEARLALVQWLHEEPIRRDAHARKPESDARHRPRAWAPGRRTRQSRATSPCCATGCRPAAALKSELEAEPDRPDLLVGAAARTRRACGADRPAGDRAGRRRLRSMLPRAAISPKAMMRRSTRLRSASSDGRRAIAALEARYREATGVATLQASVTTPCSAIISKCRARHADRLMAPDSGFTHRQTLAGVVRFNSPDLHAEASRVVEAGGHALAAEAAHFEELAVARRRLGAADCRDRRCDRPDRCCREPRRARGGGRLVPAHLTDQPCLEIEGGRHPVVEDALGAGRRAVRRQ